MCAWLLRLRRLNPPPGSHRRTIQRAVGVSVPRVCSPPQALPEALHWESVVLQQAGHYQVTPLILVNLKGCPPGLATQALVEGIQVLSAWGASKKQEAGPQAGAASCICLSCPPPDTAFWPSQPTNPIKRACSTPLGSTWPSCWTCMTPAWTCPPRWQPSCRCVLRCAVLLC